MAAVAAQVRVAWFWMIAIREPDNPVGGPSWISTPVNDPGRSTSSGSSACPREARDRNRSHPLTPPMAKAIDAVAHAMQPPSLHMPEQPAQDGPDRQCHQNQCPRHGNPEDVAEDHEPEDHGDRRSEQRLELTRSVAQVPRAVATECRDEPDEHARTEDARANDVFTSYDRPRVMPVTRMAIAMSDATAASPYRVPTTLHPVARSRESRTVRRGSKGCDEAHERRGSRAAPRRSAGSWKTEKS